MLAGGVGVNDSSVPVSTDVDGLVAGTGDEADGTDGAGRGGVEDVHAAATASGSATISQTERRIS